MQPNGQATNNGSNYTSSQFNTVTKETTSYIHMYIHYVMKIIISLLKTN